MLRLINRFFICFIPRLLGGTRANGAYSTRRLTFIGSITFLVGLSIYDSLIFTIKNELDLLLQLADRWVLIVIVSGVLVTMAGSLQAITELLKIVFSKNDNSPK